MAETRDMDGVFIDVEVDASIASDGELAAKLQEVCPVDIFAADGEGGRDDRAPRTWTSACSASCASTRRRTAPSRVKKLYDGTELSR